MATTVDWATNSLATVVATNPGDTTSWSEEQLFDWYNAVPGANETGNPDQGNASYHNLFYLADEDKVYDISRSYGRLSTNGAGQNMPNIVEYDPETNSIEWKGQFLESDAQGVLRLSQVCFGRGIKNLLYDHGDPSPELQQQHLRWLHRRRSDLRHVW